MTESLPKRNKHDVHHLMQKIFLICIEKLQFLGLCYLWNLCKKYKNALRSEVLHKTMHISLINFISSFHSKNILYDLPTFARGSSFNKTWYLENHVLFWVGFVHLRIFYMCMNIQSIVHPSSLFKVTPFDRIRKKPFCEKHNWAKQ